MPLKRILFVCLGNSCRSQMAEGFARAQGAGVLFPASAGLAPAVGVAPLTHKVMIEKGIPLDEHFPKDLKVLDLSRFDLLVNMSGVKLHGIPIPVEEWTIRDPMGGKEKLYRQVRDEIEGRVQKLIESLQSA